MGLNLSVLLNNTIETLSIISTSIYVLGLILLLVEVFIPGFGFFGISGFSCVGVGIIFKICIGEKLESIILVLAIALVLSIGFIFILIYSSKKGKGLLISKGSSLPTIYNDDDLKIFIEQKGETVTTCKPVGKIRLDNEIYEAKSLNGFLEIGTQIKVVSVKDNMLEIEKEREND